MAHQGQQILMALPPDIYFYNRKIGAISITGKASVNYPTENSLPLIYCSIRWSP